MEITVSVKVIINDDKGFDESDVSSCFQGMGQFADTVKRFVEKELDGEIKVDAVEVDGVSY